MSDNENKSTRIAGIHIAGPNSGKTAMVIIDGNPLQSSLRVMGAYGRIGNYGRHLSDDRLLELIRLHGPVGRVMVDVPLTVPPCVACERPVCPGVSSCEDVSVNYMLSLAERTAPRRQRRHRPINPQSQRLWDLVHQTRNPDFPVEPTYNSNVAPLATRARTLQRRLNFSFPAIALGETNVSHSLQALAVEMDFPMEWAREFRSFEVGRDRREQWLSAFDEQGWLANQQTIASHDLSDSIEIFHAFTAALVGAFISTNLVAAMPADYDERLGWVHLPSTKSLLPAPSLK